MLFEPGGSPTFFPVTPFRRDGSLDLGGFRTHLEARLSWSPPAVFVACGAGEFHALAVDEVAALVRAAAATVGGRVPVISGAGGPLGHAVGCVRAAFDAGLDGALVLPPYLVESTPAGLAGYVEALAAASPLPLILYHRPGAVYDLSTLRRLLRLPHVIGVKDGLGDLALMGSLLDELERTERKDVMVFNGLPTAELADADYVSAGIPIYSSAVFAASPTIACGFLQAARSGRRERVDDLLEQFFVPFDALRRRVPGQGLSVVKSAVELGGTTCGSVRPPLVALSDGEVDEVRQVLERGEDVIATWEATCPS